jgi:chitodextrinase
MSAQLTRAVVLVLAAAIAGSACSVEGVTVPSPAGPSELGLSLELTLSRDVISQDGVSTSRLDILARGANSLPVGGVSMRVDMLVPSDSGLVVADYGTLSDRWPTTSGDGRASVVYQAPPQPAATTTTDTLVTLRVTPIGSNYAGAAPRIIEVLLVRPGTIRPPTRMVPRFTFSPSNPREHDDIFFDASSSSDPDGHIVSYTWTWGDGSSGSGREDSHSYDLAGTYRVVLTVTDQFGTSVSSPATSITVGGSALPVARFTSSPADPVVGKVINFSAVTSTATAPRQIVTYEWDMGDGTFKSGMNVTHVYKAPGRYVVTLVVTDDAGRRGTTTQSITVDEPDGPDALPTGPEPD